METKKDDIVQDVQTVQDAQAADEVASKNAESVEAGTPPKSDEQTDSTEATDKGVGKKPQKLKKKEKSVSEALTKEIETLKTQLDEAKNSQMRLQADFDNYRKRNATLRTDSLSEGKCAVVKDLLKSLDNFERALNVNCSDEKYVEGIKMIYNMLHDSLTKIGLEEVETSCKFNPNIHEAVMQEEAENEESGSILLVLQKGYKFNGKVIRPAMVKVAK